MTTPFQLDAVVSQYIHAYTPLQGAVFCDYVLNTFNGDLVHDSYKTAEFHLNKREPCPPRKFWHLVEKYICPTRFEFAVWHRILMRHCYAMSRTFKFEGQTKFPLDDLVNSEDFFTDIKKLEGCIDFGMDDEQIAKLASLLKGTDTKELQCGKVFKALSTMMYDYGDMESNDRIDIRKTNTSFLHLLYRHIQQCRKTLGEWANQDKPYRSADAELSQAYEGHYKGLIPIAEGEEHASYWTRYPSMLVATPMYTQDHYRSVTSDPTVFKNIESAATYDACQRILFFSNAMRTKKGGIIEALDQFIDHQLRAGKSLPALTTIHQGLGIADYKWSQMDIIEPFNHASLTELLGRKAELAKKAEEHDDPSPREEELKEQAVDADDDPTKKAAPATEHDKKAKDDDNNTSALLIVGAIAALFLASRR